MIQDFFILNVDDNSTLSLTIYKFFIGEMKIVALEVWIYHSANGSLPMNETV